MKLLSAESGVHRLLECVEGRLPINDADYAHLPVLTRALALAKRADASQKLRELYVSERLAMPLFLLKIVAGGVVLMLVVISACYAVPTHARTTQRTVCPPYDQDSLAAHIAESGGSFMIAPLVYAMGTGMLCATLFHESHEGGGVFAMLQELSEGKRMNVVGAVGGGVLMTLGAIDWNSVATNVEEMGCDTSKKSADPISLATLLTSDISLLVAIILNFLGDSFMVGECFEYANMRELPQVIKILLDNTILVAALGLRARQKNSSFPTMIAYGGVLASIYVVCIGLGIALDHTTGTARKYIGSFNTGFVPVVLVWTLLSELAPNVFAFTDDSGRIIERDRRVSTNTEYVDDKKRKRRVGAVAHWFNQRETLCAVTTIVVFYLVVHILSR